MRQRGTIALCAALAAFALAGGCALEPETKPVDPNDALMAHLRAMFQILSQPSVECPAAADALERYVQDNRAALQALKTQLQETELALPEPERAAQIERMRQSAESLFQESLPAMMAFSQRCPAQMPRIKTALDSVVAK